MFAESSAYKPYPYVFSQSNKPDGLGISGPGGLLWPPWPPTTSNIGLSPTMPVVLTQSLSQNNLEVGDQALLTLSLSLNSDQDFPGRLSDICQIVEVPSSDKFFDTIEDAAADTSTVSVDVYIVFARSSTGLSAPPGLAASLLHDTLPFVVLMSVSGSFSMDTEAASSPELIIFDNLIYYIRLSKSSVWTVSEKKWLFSCASTDFDIEVGDEGRTLNISRSVICVSHPEKTGYVSAYFGGLVSSMSSSMNYYVRSTGCSTVMGPSWYPHMTFFPLVEVGRSGLMRILDELVPSNGDITYADVTPGYGLINRPTGLKASEYMLSYKGELLYVPPKPYDRGYSSFQPDYVDTRIIQDSCIFPVTGPEDTEAFQAFRTSWNFATRPITF